MFMELMLNSIRKIGATYSLYASERPFLVNCVTGFIIAALGDVLCQKYLEKRKVSTSLESQRIEYQAWVWDSKRSVELGVIRAFVITPFIHFWYPFVARASPGMSIASVVGRVVIDQAIGSPIVISMVFVGKSFLRGDLSSCWDRLRDQFSKTWLTGLKYWPVVHFFTFSVVPPVHRALFAHVASVYWMAQLSYFSSLEVLNSELRQE